MKFLSADSKFMTAWTNLTDAIYINILMLVTSIPIVTAGAALVAGQTAVRKMHNSEGHLTRAYFKAFKESFGHATVLWLVYLLSGAALAYSWIALQITPLMVPKIALTLVWAIGFEWTFALEARFENTAGRTFVNAFIFGVSYIWATLALAAIDVAFIALIVAAWIYMPGGLFLLIVLGYGSVLTLHVPIQEYVFRKHM